MEPGSRLEVKFTQDFEILSPLGRGAYSVVYRVKSRLNGLQYALKVIAKNSLNQARINKRLSNEIKLQSQIHHQNIIKFYKSFEDESNVYLLLELCMGGELFSYLKSQSKLSEKETKRICAQIVEGISYLHSNNILHRDLKLGNILLSENKSIVKICDFGLAVQLKDNEEERSTLCGTPNYISPEIISRKPYGLSSDLWSLGCIIYACLTGNPPFESASIQNTLLKLKDMKYSLPKDLTENALDLITKLLSWDPKSRINIGQVKTHKFFKGETRRVPSLFSQNISPIQGRNQGSFYEYSESMESSRVLEKNIPKNSENRPRSTSLNKENFNPEGKKCDEKGKNREKLGIQKSNTIMTLKNKGLSEDLKNFNASEKIEQINTCFLKPFVHKMSKGELEIMENGWVKVRIGNKRLEVSGDGLVVLYQGKLIDVKGMQKAPAKLYKLGTAFLDVVKSKTPKIIVEEKHAKCMLMRNTPFPNFEADFQDGTRVKYQIGSEVFTIFTKNGKEIPINPYSDLQNLNPEFTSILETCMEGLKKCLNKERELI